MFKYLATSLVALVFGLMPFISHAADDSRITSVAMDTQSDTTPGASSDYVISFVTSATISSGERITFLISEQGGSDASTSGFDFSETAFTSADVAGTGAIVSTKAFYGITLSSDLAAGSHKVSLNGVMNSSTVGTYLWGMTTAASLGEGAAITYMTGSFEIGSSEEGGGDESGTGLTLFAFGTNIAVSWPAYSEAAGYQLMISLTSDISGAESVDVGAVTSYIYSNLTADTTYYIAIVGYDSNGAQVIVPYPTVSVTTGKLLTSSRYTKPTVPKGKIKATTATVNWTVGDDADYIDSFSLKLKRKNTTIKTYKNISGDVLTKKLKKLKPGKKYTVQLRATYTTDETTKWSKKVSFKTKAE